MEAGKKAAGFVTDFDNLLERLKAEGYPQKYQYSEFCRMWQDLNYWKLFNGRRSESDKADFVDSCYHIVIQFFMLPRCGTHVKTICIFMLFALYTGQACLSKRRIRLTYSEFLRIFEFCGDGYENNMTEPYSIFWQLHHLG
ncbi:unnamed protein product [Oikopleura dioica]|uniref:Uncharacterized protein n=1 Tax=Oikopleura dioica TaxID=34765 RepID=E4WXV8_OIKDI|nr:unnamed protein product [Oikopleura dioica]CBY32287.1 unnamed protein product [Oikopleura dioica]CBY38353.1 unnamed protein product [Oikopleura dioica]